MTMSIVVNNKNVRTVGVISEIISDSLKTKKALFNQNDWLSIIGISQFLI